MRTLEDRYRRLLRWYPADHRRVHEDEMLGVLLSAAAPGQTRPATRDALDLARGGLGVRLRRAPAGLAQSARYAVLAILMLPEASYAVAHGSSWFSLYYSAPSHLAWAIVAVAALCGARRTTTVAVFAAVALDLVRFAELGDYAGESAAAPLLLGLITAAAVLAGPGAARGRELLGRAGLIGIAGLLAVVAPLDSTIARAALGITWGTGRMGVAIAALVAAAWPATRGPAGRRALAVLVIPLLPIVAAPFYPGYIDDPLARYLITMVAVPAATGLTAIGAVAAAERIARAAD
jgi:hypothetical protein